MSDYVPLYKGDSFTLTTSAPVTAGQLLVVTGANTVGPGGAASASWIGVAAFDAPSGAPVTVLSGGIQVVTAGGTIAAGNPVEGVATGKVAAHTAGTNDVYTVGVALTAATSGNPVTVRFAR